LYFHFTQWGTVITSSRALAHFHDPTVFMFVGDSPCVARMLLPCRSHLFLPLELLVSFGAMLLMVLVIMGCNSPLARRLDRCGLVVWVSQSRFHCNRRASARCGCNRPCGCHCTVSFDTRSWFSIAVPPSSGASGTVPRLGWCFGHYGISRAAACCSFHSLNSPFFHTHIYFELMLMHSSSRCSLILHSLTTSTRVPCVSLSQKHFVDAGIYLFLFVADASV